MILVTGASGLLGAHLLETGLARGLSLRALARSVPARSFLAQVTARVDRVSCDLVGEAPLPSELFAEVDTVVHAAALASPFPEDEPKMRALHVEGTKRLFVAARAAGVKRWVQVSSIATLSGQKTPVITEAEEISRDTAYARSKWEADRYLAGAASETQRMPILTVHPTYMFGRWDARPSSGALLLAMRLHRLRHVVDVIKNVVDARDVATGIWQALERGATGHYILGGADYPLGDLLDAASDRVGIAHLVRLAELPQEPTAEVTERELAVLRELCVPSPSSSARASRDFEYRPRTDVLGLLDETLSYFAEHKILLPKRPRPVT